MAPQSAFVPQNPYASPYAPPAFSAPGAGSPGAYGDAAGEHVRMTRGRFGAWPYVVLAFLMQIGIVTALFGFGAAMLVAVTGMPDDAGAATTLAGAGTGLLGGAALAYFTFRDRWRCIEAFSSRFCSGLMNLSLLYVPAVALVYANVRGVQKLRAR
jgi:hypothetical protein